MLPGNHDLRIYRRDSFRQQVDLWLDKAMTEPADLTGVTAKAEIRTAPRGIIIKDIGCTIILPNQVHLAMSPVDTDVSTLRGVWDLQLTYPGGDVQTVLAGAVTFVLDVTESKP
jgi:hypothetical protein